MINWFRKSPPVLPSPAPLVEPGSWFSTDTTGNPLWDRAKRYDAALKKSIQRTHADLKVVEGVAMDASDQIVFDNTIQQVKNMSAATSTFLPIHQIEWFSSQGFIGWQMCAIIAQQWLVDKACKMPGQDAIRHGWERSVNDGTTIDKKLFDKLRELDKRFKLKNNLLEFSKFSRVFGLRHILFIVEGIDYEMPFNADGVKAGAYRGMTQIDPYWIAPEFDMTDAADPASPNFYNPTWWRVNGKRVHRSHFVISRNGSDLADILKPSYFYGGISTVQKIMERVYASERTANEAPLLAMTKRLITLTLDLTQATMDIEKLNAKLTEWMGLLNNFGVKVLGDKDKVEQFDTNLAGLDETIMTQYQLVAAAAEIPATKLLGTSPKGFNASGEYEESSYHEFLEGIQKNELEPIIERHTELCLLSMGLKINMEVQWVPTDSPTAKELAENNKTKADTYKTHIDSGAIDSIDVRDLLIKDPDSGFNGMADRVIEMESDEDGEPEGGGDNDTLA